jgi:hypothetical protein
MKTFKKILAGILFTFILCIGGGFISIIEGYTFLGGFITTFYAFSTAILLIGIMLLLMYLLKNIFD